MRLAGSPTRMQSAPGTVLPRRTSTISSAVRDGAGNDRPVLLRVSSSSVSSTPGEATDLQRYRTRGCAGKRTRIVTDRPMEMIGDWKAVAACSRTTGTSAIAPARERGGGVRERAFRTIVKTAVRVVWHYNERPAWPMVRTRRKQGVQTTLGWPGEKGVRLPELQNRPCCDMGVGSRISRFTDETLRARVAARRLRSRGR